MKTLTKALTISVFISLVVALLAYWIYSTLSAAFTFGLVALLIGVAIDIDIYLEKRT